MDKEIRVLIAEDAAADAELIAQELRRSGLAHTSKWVKTKEEFLRALQEFVPDIVLCDYRMPDLSAREALEIIKKRSPAVPLIVVSGAIGEDAAVDTLKAGATDYIIKDRLAKLASAIERALEEAREHAEHRKADEALRREKELAQIYLETAAVMMLVLDRDGRVIFINQKGCDILGHEKGYIVGKDWFDNFIPERNRAEAKEAFKRLIHGEGGLFGYYESIVRTKNGAERLMGWNNTVLQDGEGTVTATFSSAEDITDRRSAEDFLKRSEERFRILYEFAPDPYYLTDANGVFIDGNIRIEDLTGYTRAALKGNSFFSLGLLSAEQAVRFASTVAKSVLGQPTGPDEFTLNRKDGTSVAVEVVTHPISLRDRVVILGVARDITARKKAEADLKNAQHRLIQSEKMAAIGVFSSGIAHEVKNPLGVILSGAEFLEARLPHSGEDVALTLEKIKKATMKANFVLQALLQFARPSEFKVLRLKPEGLVMPIVDLMSQQARSAGITIVAEIGDEPAVVPADKNQIQQVIFNTVKNSMEAMTAGGTIKIKTYRSSDKRLLVGRDACVIEITDTGHGISKENMANLFEPFFTTKEEGRGTGLGLFISKSIVENHGGRILVDSAVGKGTNVRIALPL